jgi:hypothetical protein
MKQRAIGSARRQSATALVTVFRAEHGADLVRPLRDAAAADAILAPAGPYKFPYAAALEVANLLSPLPAAPDHSDDGVLSRPALVSALRPLLVRGATLILPRLDWLDRESLRLFGELAATAALLGTGGFKLVAGACDDACLRAWNELLDQQWATVQVIAPAEFPRARPRSELVDFLCVAPHPVERHLLARACGASPSGFPAALRALHASGVVVDGARVGLGPAANLAEPENPGEIRNKLLETGAISLPAGHFALHGSSNAEGAMQLARASLRHHEFGAACHYFQRAEPRAGMAQLDEARFAHALAQAGFADSAMEKILAFKPRTTAPAVATELALAIFALATRGSVSGPEAQKMLRRAGAKSEGVRALHSILRSRLLAPGPKSARLLARVPESTLKKMAATAQLHWLLASALAHADTSRAERQRKVLLRAEQLCGNAFEALEVAQVATRVLPSPVHWQNLASRALAVMDPHALADACKHLDSPKRRLLGHEAPLSYAAVEPLSLSQIFRWLRTCGVSLLATVHEGSLRIEPPGALSRPGLAAWLHTQLNRMADFPDAFLLPRQGPPGASGYHGDVLALKRLGPFGPTIALVQPAPGLDPRALIAAIARLEKQP